MWNRFKWLSALLQLSTLKCCSFALVAIFANDPTVAHLQIYRLTIEISCYSNDGLFATRARISLAFYPSSWLIDTARSNKNKINPQQKNVMLRCEHKKNYHERTKKIRISRFHTCKSMFLSQFHNHFISRACVAKNVNIQSKQLSSAVKAARKVCHVTARPFILAGRTICYNCRVESINSLVTHGFKSDAVI